MRIACVVVAQGVGNSYALITSSLCNVERSQNESTNEARQGNLRVTSAH